MKPHYLLLFSFISCVTHLCAQLQESKLEKLRNVRYFGFSRDNPNHLFDIRDVNCSSGGSNSTIVFIVHGFFKISLEEPLKLKDDIFNSTSDVGCVIVVSWLEYSTYSDETSFADKDISTNYHKIAKTHVPYIAQDINEKLQHIRTKGEQKIQLIGHSIGAHAAGQAARYFKHNTGYEVDSIIALDPASKFFEQNPQRSLKSTDAKNVTVFHTNTRKYGIGGEIGQNDIFVNGGTNQPQCKGKLTENICSHNRGWNVYSEYLKNITTVQSTANKRIHNNRFVLCMDVSYSMSENNRSVRSVSAAKKLLSDINVGSSIGIVIFCGVAQVIHDIVEIKSDSDRESLISKLPQRLMPSTSIGAGLNVSMNLLLDLPNSDQFCSTIILLSDGEQNTGQEPEDILPELQNNCIGVNSMALGADASDNLEDISSQTGGSVIYAMENNNAQQITDTERAFSFSYENEIDPDIRPIYLLTKHVQLDNGETVIKFIIDKNIGKDTEFTFTSDNIEHFDMKLISPNGEVFTSASLEYVDNASDSQKIFRVPLAAMGKWNLIVNNVSKARRSTRSTSNAIVTVKSHQLDDDMPPIRLDASVSKRTLEYPKSNDRREMEAARIIAYAELRRGQYPIINANVSGNIEGLEETITFHLRDDGAFPDELSNDGVYTGSIVKLRQVQRYSVFVTATNENGTAKLLLQEIDYFDRESAIDCDQINCEVLSDFERESYVGSIKLISTDNENQIPPNPISDLRATILNETERLIVLEWTSPNDEAFDLHVREYDIRAFDADKDTFDSAFHFNSSQFIEKSHTSKQNEKYLVSVPDKIWKFDKKLDEPGFFLKITFAMKSIGTSGQISERSNLASVLIKDRPAILLSTHKLCRTIRKRIPRVGEVTITYC